MSFKPKTKRKIDCKDFQPCFFNKEVCKLTDKCANAGIRYLKDSWFSEYGYIEGKCTGIKNIKEK